MKYIFILTLLSISYTAESSYPDYFQISSLNQNIWIKSNNCEKLESQNQILQLWTHKLENASCEANEVRVSHEWQGENVCELNISSCLPNRIKTHQSVFSDLSGPNCWNSSLVMSGLLPEFRYSPQDEFSFYLNSPLCRQLKNNETRQAGDIGAIRESGGIEVHSFTYISDELVFSKNGHSTLRPYKLQTSEEVYKTYDVDLLSTPEECLSNVMDTNCKSGVEFFRCETMESYLTSNNILDGNFKKILTKVDNVDIGYYNLTFEYFNITNHSDEMLTNIESNSSTLIVSVKKFIESLSESYPMTNDENLTEIQKDEQKLILNILKYRIKGIFWTLIHIQEEEGFAKVNEYSKYLVTPYLNLYADIESLLLNLEKN